MEWQPIDTAPKDGTLIVVATSGGGRYIVSWRDCGWSKKPDFQWCQPYEDSIIVTVTHWIPLPDLPK